MDPEMIDGPCLLIVEPDRVGPKTDAGRVLKQMMEGDEDLLEELSLDLEEAQNKTQRWEVPRLVVGRVKDPEHGRPTEDKAMIYLALYFKSSGNSLALVRPGVEKIKKDKKEGWITASRDDEPVTSKDIQRGMYDERLTPAYWFSKEDDGTGTELAAYEDVGIKKEQVLGHYERFLVRLWAFKFQTAKLPPRSKRVHERNDEDESTLSMDSRRKRVKTGQSFGPEQEDDDDDDDEERRAIVEDEIESEGLSREYGWIEDTDWWTAYNSKDIHLTFEHLCNDIICNKIRRGFQAKHQGKGEETPHSGPMPSQHLVRRAWEWTRFESAQTCNVTSCFRQFMQAVANDWDISKANAAYTMPTKPQKPPGVIFPPEKKTMRDGRASNMDKSMARIPLLRLRDPQGKK
ncbi:hypothetical protein M409DRAFT_16767 [Zasmidium cellare ATCC 36951]|uniref:Uncharacterized protein n=1 Tax=Zasmidium cellare ATCC 36951 TaxID=1080233 RepID=A0A6A6D010_ZASCE|nr:uncharacterized protein M409DRAFT_16767 [Zasmidium cellare ATCC 36951]KAF2172807.1 hypothetical protein M409DRAFT_16767 [Zasmidium cellare ATCC 36951]